MLNPECHGPEHHAVAMAAPQGRAAFKKKDGIIAVSDAQNVLTWTPLPGTGSPTVSLPISNITSELIWVWTESWSRSRP